MAEWKLIIVSGSDARLRTVRASSFTGSLAYGNITGKPALISSSADVVLGSIVNTSTVSATKITGSFTGSFTGDGSGLTGLSAGAVTSYTNPGNNRVITSVDASTINGESNLTFDGSTLGVPNVLVSGRLTVVGTASFQHVNSIAVADRFVILNSGSTGGDGGIVIHSGSNVGYVFGWDAAQSRWGVQINSKFNATASAMVPDAFMASVVVVDGGIHSDTAIHRKAGNIKISGSAAWIWV